LKDLKRGSSVGFWLRLSPVFLVLAFTLKMASVGITKWL
jgi:hypothetical protein